jgi:hypothetical protein
MIIPVVINKKVKNVVTVAKAKGDFTDVVSALNSITDASVNNQYLIYIGPGIYFSATPIVMKEYVHITGSGQNVTTLSSLMSDNDYDSGNAALIKGASHTSLSNLKVYNVGLSNETFAMGIDLNNVSMHVENIAIISLGMSTYNYGLYCKSDQGSIIENVSILTEGQGTYNFGIYVSSTTEKLNLSNIYVKAENADTTNRAIYNNNSLINVRRSTLDVDGSGSDSVVSFGSSARTYISQSSIVSGVDEDSNIKCAACDDGAGGEVGSSCNNDVNSI